MASRFLPLILCIMCLYGGCKLAGINDGRTTDEQKISKKELCDNAVKAVGILQSEYTELEIGSSVSYQYKFDYEVDGKKYTGSKSTSEELEIPILEIFYNKNKPSQVTTYEPCAAYERVKDQPGKYPSWIEYVGMGMVLLGLMFGQSSLVKAVRGH